MHDCCTCPTGRVLYAFRCGITTSCSPAWQVWIPITVLVDDWIGVSISSTILKQRVHIMQRGTLGAAGYQRHLRVTANPNITLSRAHVPKHCQRARVVILGPLTLHDVDAASFLTFDGELAT